MQYLSLPRLGATATSLALVGLALVGLALVGLALTPASSFATPVSYGNRIGTTVDYLDIADETMTAGDPDSLFGAPTIAGDSLDFNPSGFKAESSGATLPDITDSRLTFMIKAHADSAIDSILLTEAGDTTLQRALGVADDAETEVTAAIFIDILEINHTTVANQINVTGTMDFTPSLGDYSLVADGGGSDSYFTQWTGSFFREFAPILLTNGFDPTVDQVTKISVSLDNTLTARSAALSSAFIAKKDADTSALTVDVNKDVVPEPTTALLALCGLLAMAGSRRRS